MANLRRGLGFSLFLIFAFAISIRAQNEFHFADTSSTEVSMGSISNGDRSGSNRGLNQFVIYAGFSIFK